MNHLETALRTLGDDPLAEAAPSNLADRALTRAQTRQRAHRRGVFSVVGAAAVVALVAGGITAAANHQRPAPAPVSPASPVFAKPRMNVLLIGSDAAPNRIGVRPDTIILSSIDTRTGATTLLSLPRSLQGVPFPAGSPGATAWPKGFSCQEAGSGNECLLNSVWSWAEASSEYRADPHAGLTATTQVVEEISGLSVDETVVVAMQGLVDLVDAVGGVDVTVHERLPIGGDSVNRQATGWLEKGRQHLNGRQALWFARSRWSTNDYDRMLRQQCLITALAQQVDARTLVTRFQRIAGALGRSLSTSIPAKDLASWADLALRMRSAPITQLSVQMPGGSANPDYAEIRRRIKVLTTTPNPATDVSASDAANTAGVQRQAGTTPPASDDQWLRSDAC